MRQTQPQLLEQLVVAVVIVEKVEKVEIVVVVVVVVDFLLSLEFVFVFTCFGIDFPDHRDINRTNKRAELSGRPKF